MFYNIVYIILLLHCSTSLINAKQIERQISSVLIVSKLYFGKKQFTENESFTNFWFVGSKN